MKSRVETRVQLEMTFDGAKLRNVAPVQSHRRAQAHWWFGKMRQVVDLALGPKTRLQPKPEQTYLSLSQKTVWH